MLYISIAVLFGKNMYHNLPMVQITPSIFLTVFRDESKVVNKLHQKLGDV
jgi:hypothetical protein